MERISKSKHLYEKGCDSINITIHRGTHQIGGCITEICTKQGRIFIDFGTELPELDGTQPKEYLSIAGLTEGTKDCDAVFFTHYHGDHIGNMDRILSDVPLYMGKTSREISLILNRHLQKAYHYNTSCFPDKSSFLRALERTNTFESGQTISIKDMDITPYRVDHSAFDSYFFLIEVDGVRVLHTGDFRDHGFTGDELPSVLKQIGQVDCLICEGTMLSRGKEETLTEEELSERAKHIMIQHKNVFVLCSSTNIDRIRALYEAKPKEKPGVSDWYQKQILNAVSKSDPTIQDSYQFKWIIPATDWNYKLHNWMCEKGFVMFVRVNDRFRRFMDSYRGNCKVIYSMWSGYLENPRIAQFLEGYDYTVLHTSGHAVSETIRTVIQTVKPRKIIPLHTEAPDIFFALAGASEVDIPKDGQPVFVSFHDTQS